MTLVTSIFMCLQCYRKGQSTFLVRFSELSHPSHARLRALHPTIDKCMYADKGTAKVAKDLGMNYAEAVVRI